MRPTRCDVCHSGYTGPGRNPKDRRATTRYSVLRREGYHKLISAGSIELCGKCWEFICQPRMRPLKGVRYGEDGA